MLLVLLPLLLPALRGQLGPVLCFLKIGEDQSKLLPPPATRPASEAVVEGTVVAALAAALFVSSLLLRRRCRRAASVLRGVSFLVASPTMLPLGVILGESPAAPAAPLPGLCEPALPSWWPVGRPGGLGMPLMLLWPWLWLCDSRPASCSSRGMPLGVSPGTRWCC